ncbi:MAG: SAM-dependent methyltransferase [Planctomycetota bacterium]|nr:MAG: SAM-dependent methyltransferase [Planctomycetota bacterium]
MHAPAVFPHDPIEGYALLDCGDGEKLERFGGVVLRRPDPLAMWRPERDAAFWAQADLSFVRESDRGGRWQPRRGAAPLPEPWTLTHRDTRLLLRPTPFKHVGVFPEQASNWLWTAQRIAQLAPTFVAREEPRPRLLNLFAYTGAASVAAAQAGAFVTHVDASKPAMRWARENAAASGLAPDAVRWICDDALQFVQRERRRGRRYDGVLLDPPPYGRGPDGQRWTFEEGVVELLADIAGLLEPDAGFVVLSCYAVGTSPLAFQQMLAELGAAEVSAGELALPVQDSARLLPAGLCARWWRAP